VEAQDRLANLLRRARPIEFATWSTPTLCRWKKLETEVIGFKP
jgi:hypothetical protein